jgi:hypothetical protein
MKISYFEKKRNREEEKRKRGRGRERKKEEGRKLFVSFEFQGD